MDVDFIDVIAIIVDAVAIAVNVYQLLQSSLKKEQPLKRSKSIL